MTDTVFTSLRDMIGQAIAKELQENPNADWFNSDEIDRVADAAMSIVTANAVQALSIPEGFKLMPTETTPQIEDALSVWLMDTVGMDASIPQFRRAYKAIVDSVPKVKYNPSQLAHPLAGNPDMDKIMQEWDKWRAYYINGGYGTWPRDAFECLLDHLMDADESMQTAVSSHISEQFVTIRQALAEAMGRGSVTSTLTGQYEALQKLMQSLSENMTKDKRKAFRIACGISEDLA